MSHSMGILGLEVMGKTGILHYESLYTRENKPWRDIRETVYKTARITDENTQLHLDKFLDINESSSLHQVLMI